MNIAWARDSYSEVLTLLIEMCTYEAASINDIPSPKIILQTKYLAVFFFIKPRNWSRFGVPNSFDLETYYAADAYYVDTWSQRI